MIRFIHLNHDAFSSVPENHEDVVLKSGSNGSAFCRKSMEINGNQLDFGALIWEIRTDTRSFVAKNFAGQKFR